ncbi:DUF551 domain-containing protein [Klebsiella pneumoniae]|uniref:DUF551 domain-containing protein n=1 Tax=Klebsiella pneumoniae TaxID=573 RepID=UPI001D0D24BA|nr:DUF551 domain-containing protein [Klebsiella pneumoniae]
MTSKLTREQLIKKAQEQIAFCRHTKITGEGLAHVNQCAALFEIALAAMDSEPVAWTWHYREQWHVTNDEERARDLAWDGVKVEPLYRHAQPSPVGNEFIPKNLDRALGVLGMALPESKEELNLQSERWIQRLIDRVIRYADEFKAQPAPVVPDAYVRDERGRMMLNGVCEPKIGFGADWNACRTTMLAASPQSPGSEPATVPGKWIPVSEQMPEAGGDMIVFTDGIVMSGVSYAKKKGFYIQALEYDADEPVDGVTHWMPLPAAPQEVKGE